MAKNSTKQSPSFSDEERVAMQERAQEIKAQTNKADSQVMVLEKITQMPQPDQSMAKQLHTLIMKNFPNLSAKTWYGMPAYIDKAGQIICFFQNAGKFKARYQTLGFSDKAKLDDGNMWPSSYALTQMTPAEETKIIALLKKATS